MSQDHDFLEYIVKELVDHPEEVKINRRVDEMGVLLELDVHSEDMGKIIGRKGNTAKSIRTLLRVVGMKHNARVNLKINEPSDSQFQGDQYNDDMTPQVIGASQEDNPPTDGDEE